MPSSYGVPPPLPPADELVEMVRERLGARCEQAWSESRTVLDSSDRRLRRAAIVLEAIDGADRDRVLVVRGWGRSPLEPPVPIRELPTQAAQLPARIRRAIGEVIDGCDLEQVGVLEVAVHSLAVRDDEHKAVLRAAVELAGNAAWVRVMPVKGYRSALSRGVARIGTLGLRPDAEPVESVHAVAPASGRAERLPRSRPPGEPLRASAAEVWLGALSGQLELMTRYRPAAIEGTDPEALHDLRVAVRRSRSALRHAKGVLPTELTACFRPLLTDLQRATGPVRDLDVLIESLALETDPELAPVATLARHRRSSAREDLEAVLSCEGTTALLEDWGATLAALGAAVEAGEADEWGPWPSRAHEPAGKVVAHRIERQRGRFVSLGAAMDETSPAETLHELRKQGKELRYLIELFGAYAPEIAAPKLLKALKKLQDLLGRHQDHTVQLHALAELRDVLQPSARPAVDRLLSRLEEHRGAERQRVLERFTELAGSIAAARCA